MLKLLESDIAAEDSTAFAQSCIAIIRQEKIREKINEINRKLTTTESTGEDYHQLLAEKQRLSTLLHNS